MVFAEFDPEIKKYGLSDTFDNFHFEKDEKYQLNAFLYDWLVACVERGQSTLNWDVNNGLV